MKVGVMQPYFFPYIGYWQLINSVDKYIIYDDVNFIKRGWINRNRILINGIDKMINIQLKNISQNKLINEIEVTGDGVYNKKLLKTIESNYSKAPYYSVVFPIVKDIINQKETNFALYLEYQIRQICKYLSIETEILVSSSIRKNNKLKGQDKIIDICNVLGADEYINAIGGQELYSHEKFNNYDIKLKFLKTGNVEYKQFKNQFVSNLSIIDVMMFNSQLEIKEILTQLEYIQ